MFIFVAAKPGLVKKVPVSERGVQMSGNGSRVLVRHSSGREVSLVVKFISETVHRVSLSPVPYKGFLYISSLPGG